MRKRFHRSLRPRAAVLGAAVLLAALSTGVAIAASGGSGGERTLAAAPQNTSPPTVNGTLTQGATLTANPGTWNVDAPPATFAYQWFRCDGGCVPIAGANQQSYTLQGADVGDRVLVQVTAVDSDGAISVAVNSAQSANVIAAAENPPVAPTNVVAPAIGGAAVQGETLVAFAGQWNAFPVPLFIYLWLRCGPTGNDCAPIAGAGGPTYTPGAVDVATTLRVQVTATNSAGTEPVTSPATQLVSVPLVPQNTQLPAITGTPKTGETLSSTNGQWSGAGPFTFAQQWQRCNAQGESCQPIQGATGPNYVVQQGDVGARLVVEVTASNQQGEAKATSQPTGVVEASIPPGGTIPISEVSLPNRLVIAQVDFTPNTVGSRAPFTGRFRVLDTEGHPVSGAQVWLVGIPFGRIGPAPTLTTGADGWATFTLRPTARMPLQRGFLITMFVRATKPGDDLLAGVSTRRLVSIRVVPR